MPQKAEVLKKGRSKNTDDVNIISIDLTSWNFFLKTKKKTKKVKKDIIVIDNWNCGILLEKGFKYELIMCEKGIVKSRKVP